jgi:hypothetical protein
MNDHEHDDDDGPRQLRYASVMPLIGALTSMARDAPTPEERAQCGALATARVLMPGSRDRPERQHAAYVEVLRTLLRAPLSAWPPIAHPIHATACVLLDDAGELSDDELDRYFPDTTKETP